MFKRSKNLAPKTESIDVAHGAFVGKAALGGNVQGVQEAFTGGKESIRQLADTLPKLVPGKPTRVNLHDMVSVDPYGKNHTGLVGIILAGDTAVGIVANNRTHHTRPDNPHPNLKPQINVVELPYGEHASQNKRTSKIVDRVYPEFLEEPREDGVVQSWETIALGRANRKVGVENIGNDPELSRKHFSVTVDANAGILVTDEGSTNGTVLITASTLIQNPDNAQLMSLHSHLQDPANQAEWSYLGFGHEVIPSPNPQS